MAGYLHEDLRYPNLVHRIQRSPQAVVVEILGADARSYQDLNWFVSVELTGQIQRTVHNPQAIQHQRLDRLTYTHLAPSRADTLVNLPDEVNLLAYPGHNPQMVELLCANLA